MGAATKQLACQFHTSQIASTHPSQLRRPVSHPPTSWEGSPNRMGAKDGGDNLTRMSPETTTSLRADNDTSKAHPGAAHRHPTPFEGRKPQRREGWPKAIFTTRQLVWSHHQQGEHRRSRGASSGHLWNHGRSQLLSMGTATEQLA